MSNPQIYTSNQDFPRILELRTRLLHQHLESVLTRLAKADQKKRLARFKLFQWVHVCAYPSALAASCAKYVTMNPAPARRIESSDSSIARCGSSQPFAKAAWSIEYSPETW